MSIRDYLNAPKIKKENERLLVLFEKINATEAINVQNNIDVLKGEHVTLENTINKVKF